VPKKAATQKAPKKKGYTPPPVPKSAEGSPGPARLAAMFQIGRGR